MRGRRRGWAGLLSVCLSITLPVAGCGSPSAAPPERGTAPFALQVKFANVDENIQVLTAVVVISPGDATHVTLDLWNVELKPSEAYRAVGHVTRNDPAELGIAIELYGEAALAPGSYLFGGENPNCSVPSIAYGGIEYQLAPHPSYPGQVRLDSVDLSENGQVSGYIDLECYYGEIIRGSFTAVVHWR